MNQALHGPRRFSWWGLVALSLLLLGLAALFSFRGRIEDRLCAPQFIARLLPGKDRVISITADRCWELNRAVYYAISDHGQTVSPAWIIDFDGGDERHDYQLIHAEKGQLVGVCDRRESPPKLMLMFDFGTHETWPRPRDREVAGEPGTQARWRDLFTRLRAENQQLTRPEAIAGPRETAK